MNIFDKVVFYVNAQRKFSFSWSGWCVNVLETRCNFYIAAGRQASYIDLYFIYYFIAWLICSEKQ